MSTTIKKIEEQRFEFLLYINKNIICQRYFSIKDFNPDSIYSIELKELMDRLVGMNNGNFGSLGLITRNLKNKAVDYLWRNYNPHQFKNDEPKNNYEKEDIFEFEIRVDKNIITKSYFSGNHFPQQVRYQVDIKDIIPKIITDIKDTLSQKIYNHYYGDLAL